MENNPNALMFGAYTTPQFDNSLDMEDIVQDNLMVACKAIELSDITPAPAGYIYKAIKNRSINRARDLERERNRVSYESLPPSSMTYLIDSLCDEEGREMDALVAEDYKGIIEKLLKVCTPVERQVIEQFYLSDKEPSFSDIESGLGISPGYAKVLSFRALSRMRQSDFADDAREYCLQD